MFLEEICFVVGFCIVGVFLYVVFRGSDLFYCFFLVYEGGGVKGGCLFLLYSLEEGFF